MVEYGLSAILVRCGYACTWWVINLPISCVNLCTHGPIWPGDVTIDCALEFYSMMTTMSLTTWRDGWVGPICTMAWHSGLDHGMGLMVSWEYAMSTMCRHLTWSCGLYIDHTDGAKMCHDHGSMAPHGVACACDRPFDMLDEPSESMAFEQAIGLHHRMPRHRDSELDMLICGWTGLNRVFLLVTWFWEKPTFRSKTRFAPHLTISSRLASFLVHFEQLFFGYISLLKLEQGWGKHIQVVVGQLLQRFDGTIKKFMLTLT